MQDEGPVVTKSSFIFHPISYILHLPSCILHLISGTLLQWIEYDQRLADLDEFAVQRGSCRHQAGAVGGDLVENFHRFDDADRLPHFHHVANFDESRRIRRRRAVKDADQRRGDDMTRGGRCLFRWRRGDLMLDMTNGDTALRSF